MTANANKTDKNVMITIEAENGKKFTFPLADATDVITQTLAARKQGYAMLRDEKKAAKATKAADRIAKLQEKLAELTAAPEAATA